MPVAAGRRPLSRAAVLEAAVALADADGIDALTVRRLAAELGVHPTSLYNHVPSKEAILDGVAERLIAEAELPTSFATWQDWVPAFARCMRGIARDHPGAFRVFTRRPAGRGADAHLEAALDAFERGGFAPLRAGQAVAGTALAILGLALNEAPPPPAAEAAPLDPKRYPRIAAAATAARRAERAVDGMWELLVASLVTGLDAEH